LRRIRSDCFAEVTHTAEQRISGKTLGAHLRVICKLISRNEAVYFMRTDQPRRTTHSSHTYANTVIERGAGIVAKPLGETEFRRLTFQWRGNAKDYDKFLGV
jgi:hypothetical protein